MLVVPSARMNVLVSVTTLPLMLCELCCGLRLMAVMPATVSEINSPGSAIPLPLLSCQIARFANPASLASILPSPFVSNCARSVNPLPLAAPNNSSAVTEFKSRPVPLIKIPSVGVIQPVRSAKPVPP